MRENKPLCLHSGKKNKNLPIYSQLPWPQMLCARTTAGTALFTLCTQFTQFNIPNCHGVPPTGEANPSPGSVQGQDEQGAEQPGLNLGRETPVGKEGTEQVKAPQTAKE